MSLSAAGYILPPPGAAPDDPNASCSTDATQVVGTVTRDMPAIDSTWKLYATGDLDGDGILDIVWLKPDGTLAAWLMNGNGFAPTVLQNIGVAPVGFTVFQP